LLGRKDSNWRVLFGNDTDVTWVCYVNMGKDMIVQHTYWEGFDDTFTDKNLENKIMTDAEFTELFNLQYGSPMHFIDKEDFEKFMAQHDRK
jgi:hypothetical protein